MQQQSDPMLMTRRTALTGGALVSGALVSGALVSGAFPLRTARADTAAASMADENGISHTASAIHQEPAFPASPARVYAALLDPRQFDRMVELSGVLQEMHLPSAGSRIDPHVGAAFALFGSYITGRQLELVRNQRIVQSWREASWPAGIHSIAHFEFQAHDSGCRIVFDHTGIPSDAAQSLAEGWQSHYWEPLRKLMAS
jgi:activator of HSP90 ATPase